MQIELPDQLINEKVEQRRPLLLSVTQVADELSCSRASVFGLIHGGHLEAMRTGRTYRVATATFQQYVDELSRPSYERDVVSARSMRARAPRQTGRGPSNSRQAPATSVLPATKPPRVPRPKQKKVSKKEAADMPCTVAEFAGRWWGMESAVALLERSGIALTQGTDAYSSFRYGDLVEWMENHHAEFEQWTREFDPALPRRDYDGDLRPF
jgi:excisionase family DNA binding protein